MKKVINDNYTLRQLKNYYVKVQLNIAEIYGELTLALKDKNANLHKCHLKKNKSLRKYLGECILETTPVQQLTN